MPISKRHTALLASFIDKVCRAFQVNDPLSGYSVAYNLGPGVIGGATPIISTWLIEKTRVSTASATFMTAMAVITFLVMVWIKDGSRKPLP